MSKTFRPYTPGQCLLLPPSPMDWLPEGHLARFILDLMKDPLPKHKIPTTEVGAPTEKSQRNFADLESRMMRTGDGYVQGYNCQPWSMPSTK